MLALPGCEARDHRDGLHLITDLDGALGYGIAFGSAATIFPA